MNKITVAVLVILLAFSRAAAQESPSPEHLYSRALLLISEKQYAEALNMLNRIEDESSMKDRQHHILYQMAVCHYNLDNHQKAETYAQRSLDREYTYDQPYLFLFNLYNNQKKYDDSVYALHSLVELKPETYEYHYTLGAMYAEYIRNAKLSIKSFERVIELSEEISIPAQILENSYIHLSNLYMVDGSHMDAIKAGSESVKFNPKNNMRLYTMANYFISNNMLPEAIITVNHFLQNLTDEQRDNEFLYKVYAFMGRMYFLQEKRDAMTYLRLGAQDTSTDGEIARALFDYLTRNNESSREGIREIMKKDNSYISTHFAMAQIFEKEGKVSEAYDYYIATALMLYNSGMNDTAKRALLKGLRIKPEVPKLHEMLASIYEREEKYSTAIYHYKKADPSGSDIQNLLHITYLYYTIEDYENARKTLQKARQREDGSGRIFFTSGVIESGQKRYFEAIQYYNKAIETDDSNPSYYFYRAIVQDKAGHVEDATASLEKAVELDGENSEYLNYLGYTYAERGIKLDKALKLISDAVKQKPFNGAYLDSMGWVYYKQGQYKKAERFLTRAYRNLEAENTHDPVVYDHLGDTYRKMKQSRRAVHYWELALKHGADDKQSIRSKISQTLGENR